MNIVDLVKLTASPQYMRYGAFEDAIFQSPAEIEKLLGAGIGLSGEVGEFNELLKKHVFQGKVLDLDHAKKELGDIYWYFALACIALETTPQEIEEIVSKKLMKRFSDTNGVFNQEQNDNRKKDDV